MAKQVLNNGETHGALRGKTNDNFTELYNSRDAHLADNAAHGITIPPTAYDIAYINSLVAQGGNTNYYCKNKFGEVTIIARYCKSGTSDDIASGVGTILFNLPAGHRPSAQMLFSGKAMSTLAAAEGIFQTDVFIYPDGNIVVVTPGNKNYRIGDFSITFKGV